MSRYICEACEGKGYLEVTHSDSCEYIEACQECNGFTEGSMGDCTNSDTLARAQAIEDGYKLSDKGKILC